MSATSSANQGFISQNYCNILNALQIPNEENCAIERGGWVRRRPPKATPDEEENDSAVAPPA